MIENLKRSREPLAWIAIVLTALGTGLGVWRLVSAITSGELGVFAAFQEASNQMLNITGALLVVVLVMMCSFVSPATAHARLVTWVGAWLLTIGVLLTAVSILLGMWASAALPGIFLDILGGLLDLAFKALAAGLLWVFLRGVRAGRIETAPTEEALSASSAASPAAAPSGAEDVEWASSWLRSESSGTVWRTAGDAARGEPGAERMPSPDDPASPQA